jgi:four helix bundle protein
LSDGAVQKFNRSRFNEWNVFNIFIFNNWRSIMPVKQFEDLEVWRDARRLTQAIYRLTRAEKFSKDFALRDQIQRATISIMSNIAEGFERGGNQEFCQFLYIAKGSCGEVRSQLYIALDQSYVSRNELDQLL